MRNRNLSTAALVFLLSSAATGCGRSWTPVEAGRCVFHGDCPQGMLCFDGRCIRDLSADGGSTGLAGFGEPCMQNTDCSSGLCLPVRAGGGICTRPCDPECPPPYLCKTVRDPRDTGQRLALCALDTGTFCNGCSTDADCDPAGGDACLSLSGGNYCGVDCSFGSCPAGAVCTEVSSGGFLLRQCVPEAGSCDCTEQSAGLVRGCDRENEWGRCTGLSRCVPPDGWTECSAKEPRQEDCNGIDDDCDGLVDEQLETSPCEVENEFGRCTGQTRCMGTSGWLCDAPEPAAESCNGIDDDCDGETDEDFRDAQGRYVLDEHCGSCNADCLEMVPHSTRAMCVLVDDVPVCRAVACEEGYFPWQDGLACLLLPANLCQPCRQDEDCLVPGSLCLQTGPEHFCGRDCSPSSPYGTSCPRGYSCLPASNGAMQCQPESGSCLCDENHVGTVRSCLVDTCVGYQVCRQDQNGGFTWSDCNVEDFNPEICDSLDNNCNGQIDEGFLNQQTGKYDSNEHCGFCNNDCGLLWNPEIHHTTGVCDASGAPRCVMGPCLVESEGGTDYEWVDTNGDPSDGCECRRRLGNTGYDPPDLFEYPAPGQTWVDENCDGVDGVVQASLFVRAGAPPGGDGSLQNPFATITEAIEASTQTGLHTILVAEGKYAESVRVPAGVELHGGYSADFRQRDLWLYQSVIRGTNPRYALALEGVTGSPVVVSGFVIEGADIVEQPQAPGQAGTSTVAVLISECDGGVVLRSNVIRGGRGGDGAAGASGEAGTGRQQTLAVDGGAGRQGVRRSGTCWQDTLPGGAAGHNPDCPSSDGNPGATTRCPSFDWSSDPVRGAQAQYHDTAGGNGLGGYDWSFDGMSGPTCSHATESGFPSDIQLNVGLDGADGQDGSPGTAGRGATDGWGAITPSGFLPGNTATAGGDGAHGQGGGGGGGGGGTARWWQGPGDCDMYEVGPSGGGGGAGGCGGTGGGAGGDGGASIAVLVVAGTNGEVPSLLFNMIERGPGGRGGAGGGGGMGGVGGVGGFGGGPPDWISSQGGKGGDGGNGGPGGGGGGGAGGPSYGIASFGADPGVFPQSNEFLVPDEVPTGGTGGAGGQSGGGQAQGGAGVDGRSANLVGGFSCRNSPCPSGYACRADGWCRPDW